MRRSKKRPLVVAIAVLTALGVASASAYAYWTTTGSGSGSAAITTSQPVSVSQLNAGTTPINLQPGGSPQYIEFRITNPSTTKQKVGTVTVSITGVVYDASWGAPASGVTADGRHGDNAHPCSASDFTLDTSTKAINAELNPGATDYTGSTSGLQIHMIDAVYNQDDCKNATVQLHFDVSAGV